MIGVVGNQKMNLNKHLLKLLASIVFLFSALTAESYWVRYGWQAFKNAGDAQSLSLGQSQTASYHGAASVLQNPAHAHRIYDRYLYAHQNRFAGLVNSDLVAFPTLKRFRNPVKTVLFHEGVSHIPDTRNVLLDWGHDGIPGTGDAGEDNGQLDEGERLDADKVSYFRQSQWGVHFSSSWMWKQWSLGIGLKGFFHSLAEHYASGIGLDIGATRSFWEGNSVGLVITDATTSLLVWDNGTVERFTPEIFAGIAQTYEFEKLPIRIKFMADVAINPFGKSPDDDLQMGEIGGRYRGGLELKYDRLAVRFGRGLNALTSAGLGMDWGQSAIHYAFITASRSSFLGDSHLISFSLDPKWLVRQLGNLL
ncbi:MAG TPA: hypothetical protein DD389_01370 [Candidatus Marinimicrobia bacterium]|nr:hypothetical protein [Candidatus Neomarinimicrobiota bacterium]